MLVLILLAPLALAEDIEGVQPAALDQPRINLVMRRQPKGPVLGGKVMGEEAFNVEAFLDTGASSIVLSSNTASQLGVKREIVGGNSEARFEDVGVGGGSKFAISEPLFLSLAPYSPAVDVEHKDVVDGVYTQTCGPFRTEIGPLDSGGDLLTQLAMGDLDIAGTPVMAGKVVVMDTKDVNKFTDKIRTVMYDATTRVAAQVPKTKRHVQLSYATFQRFTKTTPNGAQSPAISANPFIGPSPIKEFSGDVRTPPSPPITASHNGKTARGSWLLDTGAVASMISRHEAAALGVAYVPGTDTTDSPRLSGVPAAQQFTLSVGGIGGTKKAAGFYLDSLSLMTREGEPLRFVRAPVLVVDITVKDQSSGQSLTLDGVFGMNFLVASADVKESGLMPDIGKLTAGAFRLIVFDQPAGTLGLE
jgi:hypothetical protein